MRLVITFLSLSLVFASSTQEVRLSKLGETPMENDPSRLWPDLSFSVPSTTGGWDDLYREAELQPAEGETALSSGALLPNWPAPTQLPSARDEPGSVIGIIAVVLCLGALRLFFTSAGFRKFLWETFSPLSPLGY